MLYYDVISPYNAKENKMVDECLDFAAVINFYDQ